MHWLGWVFCCKAPKCAEGYQHITTTIVCKGQKSHLSKNQLDQLMTCINKQREK